MSYLNKKYITSALRNNELYTKVLNAEPNSKQEKTNKEELYCALEKDVLKELDEFMESFDKSIAADREEKKKLQEAASAKEELLNAIKKYNDVTEDGDKIKVKFSENIDNPAPNLCHNLYSLYDPSMWDFIDDLFSSL